MKIVCSWCSCGPESGETTPPCGACLKNAKKVVEASTTAPDRFVRAIHRYNAAIDGLKTAKREMRKATKVAKKRGWDV